ncbi:MULTISPECIES: hypothetical protein [unclassified Micromonospora]|uniref:hypothetical protein n=1 Tax=unclassified Micromonospora TaxID=2617518 RepID=UPI002FF11349
MLPGIAAPQLGLIGRRQLICVQTFNIARLTSHPVALIPGAFIAVTGRGPKDSNESGKTSFLAAVSLLLGDPEWRTGGTGAANVATLLFDAATAGDVATAHAAGEGYVVGVFAEPDDVAATAYTVWLKVSSRTPYVQVRHEPGVRLVVAKDDRERHEVAPETFQSLGGQSLGGGEYPSILYGRTPRVLAYVATRGKVRSRPSLLKLDAGTFTPEQIGDTLLSVTGRAALFENDAEVRRKLAATQARLEEVLEDDKIKTEREEAIRRQVTSRNRLRYQTKQAMSLWRPFRSRQLLDTYARAASAKAPLAETEADLAELRRTQQEQAREQARLRDVIALRRTAEEKAGLLRKTDDEYDRALADDTRLADRIAEWETRIGEARLTAAGYDLSLDGAPASAAEQVQIKATELAQARAEQAKASTAFTEAEEALRQARAGRVGVAGAYIRTLDSLGITAVGLAEGTRLAPEGRGSWEARIAPWREAICVASGDLPDALEALRSFPGAIVISPDNRTIGAPSDANRQVVERVWPAGVLEAPAEANDLLHALASQDEVAAPVPYVTDPRTGVHTIGGFTSPIVGKEDICAHFAQQLQQAKDRLDEANRQVAARVIAAEQAEDTLARAEAAQLVDDLEPQIVAASKQLATHRGETLPQLRDARDTARDENAAAKQALANRDTELSNVANKIRKTKHDVEAKESELARLRVASRPDDQVLAAWPWGTAQALAQLGWPTDAIDAAAAERLVEEAAPPMQVPDGPPVERRPAAALARAAHAQLTAMVAVFGHDGEGAGPPGADLAAAASAYQNSQSSGEEDSDGSLFDTTIGAIETWLNGSADRDSTAEEQIQQQQAKRALENEYVATQVQQLVDELAATQQAITQRAETRLDAISAALDQLNRAAGGLGADLQYSVVPPGTPDADWVCQVTPRWRRNTAGRLLAYDTVTNTAQEKLFSIHLVLAALLAAPEPCGRVLILDELGDSLGTEHRRDVLEAIAKVAKDHGITVLGTCQDSIMIEARSFCREILFFNYPSKSEALNRPTRMFGYDTDGKRVEQIAEALLSSRSPTQF